MKKLVNNFVHLRIYTEYSIEQSLLTINEIINLAKIDNQKILAITDLNNLFNSVKFYKECIKNKIKPIIGCEIYIKRKFQRKPYKILLLIKNNLGYLNLSKLLSKACLYNKIDNICQINKNWFKGNLSKGLILLSGAQEGDIGYYLIKRNYKIAKKKANFWKNLFINNFYIEIQKYNKISKYCSNKSIKLANELNLPLVATHPILFKNKNDFFAHEIRNCIYKNINLTDLKKINLFSKKQYFYKKKKIIKLFKNTPSAIINTLEISKRCNLKLNLEKIKLPFFKLKNITNNEMLIKLSIKGLNKKFKKKILKKKKYLFYKKKLMHECKIIIYMGFSDYFLIVNDFIKWAKKKKIPVGPGRGSGAGSLVSYVLNITNIDPIKYNLIFERFLNPQRISLPDFDIDFCQKKREKVINYVKKKYGINSVCQIITFGKFAIRSSIKDVGRIMNFNYNFINELSKLIPFKTDSLKIIELIKKNSFLNLRYNKEIEVKSLIDLSNKIEGLTKSIGVHAGGLLISSDNIYNFCPIYTQNNIIITQYCKDDIELIGLLKFDFLGLTSLTIINNCIKTINKNYNKKKNILNKIFFKNKYCFYNLKKGDNIGIFQLESKGMKDLIKKAQPNCFENIIALISLYRPGPIELLNSFCLRKLGKEKITYLDYRLKNILKETYGVIIYQEQIMQIVRKISNYSLSRADILRKSISKKDPIEMSKERNRFCAGAVINKVNITKANKIFNFIEKFSGYGFNKSHATAYALLSYYTIWLKTYYFSEFMSANMSYCFNDIKKLNELIENTIKNNIFILPLNINKSDYMFISFKKNINKIRYGFSGIKGLGEITIKEILKIRKLKLFVNLVDFIERTKNCLINYKIIEILISSGAFDCIDLNRGNLNYNLIKKKNLLKINLNLNFKLKFKKIKKIKKNFFWNFKIKSIEEKNSLGFFFFYKLYNIYRNKFKNILMNDIKDIKKKFIYIGGIIYDIKEKLIINKKIYFIDIINENHVTVKIDDKLYKYFKNMIKINNFIIFYCQVNMNKNKDLIFLGKKIKKLDKNVKNTFK